MTVSEKLRLVQGLHSHAEMFGFNWNDESDWTWHDVACKIADEIDTENDKLREQSVRLLDKTLELASENDKLRDEFRKMDEWHSRELVAAIDENTKLRELLRDTLITTDQYCDKYGIEYEGEIGAWGMANADIDRRLRELGIEVD